MGRRTNWISLTLVCLSFPVQSFAGTSPAAQQQIENIRRAQENGDSQPVQVIPVLPSEIRLNRAEDFPQQEQCSGSGYQVCIRRQTCPERDRAKDFFHYSELSICLKVFGTYSEMYAPTPSSDAIRMMKGDLADLQIPLDWVQSIATFDGTIPLKFDSRYYWSDSATQSVTVARLRLGEGGTAGLRQGVLGPHGDYMQEYQLNLRDLGLGEKFPVHTRIFGEGDGYRYRLYHPFGEPLEKMITKKDGLYFSAVQALANPIKKYGSVDGYARTNRYEFYCFSNMVKPKDAYLDFSSCNGSIRFSGYVVMEFEATFASPLPQMKVIDWFNKTFARVRPLYLGGRQPTITLPEPNAFGIIGLPVTQD